MDVVLRDRVWSAGGMVDLFQPKQPHNSVSINAVLDKDDLYNSTHFSLTNFKCDTLKQFRNS